MGEIFYIIEGRKEENSSSVTSGFVPSTVFLSRLFLNPQGRTPIVVTSHPYVQVVPPSPGVELLLWVTPLVYSSDLVLNLGRVVPHGQTDSIF